MFESTSSTLLCILALPLLSATIIGLLLRKTQWLGAMVSVAASITIAYLSIKLLLSWDGQTFEASFPWFELGQFQVDMGLLLDSNTAIMLAVVSVIGCLIHIFSLNYMASDPSKSRFFGGLSLFMFAMLGIVMSDNLIMMFVFWELVGFCSYMLIAHYYKTNFASWASKKAFIVNRVGDFGFILGIVWSYWHFGTVHFQDISSQLALYPQLASTLIGLFLICGFLGKSAQFPLHIWLPDAMAGPTPVSALIHAATMVAAGIYFLSRIFVMLTPDTLDVILWLSAIMTLFAGFVALSQSDIKKILAYSTLAQLGYMGVAVGLGYPGLALFHMATHACFKACLFLGSGSVIHAMHHEQDIFKMGGLLKKMPITALTFAISTLALCGVYGTAGFFSKDTIIEGAYLANPTVFGITLFSAFLTALYMGRLFWITFLGQAKSDKATKAKENTVIMWLPLLILAFLSIATGYTTLWPEHWAASFIPELSSIHTTIHEANDTFLMILFSSFSWVLGLLISYFFYKPGASSDALESTSPALFNLSKSKFGFDTLYELYVSKIQQRFANILHFLDLALLSGLLIRGSAHSVAITGYFFRKLHSGKTHTYIYWFFVGIFIFGLLGLGWL